MDGTGIQVPRPAETSTGPAPLTWVFFLLIAYLAWTLPYFVVKYWSVLTQWSQSARG